MTEKLEGLVLRLEAAVQKLETFKSGGGGGDESEANLFQEFLNQHFTPLTEAAKKLPEQLQNITKLYKGVFDEVDKFLQIAKHSKKPAPADLPKLIVNHKKSIEAFLKYTVKVPIDYKNHVKALEESVKANNWIISSQPVSEVYNARDIADVYALKIKNPPDDVAWVKALRALNVNLEAFVKENYKMGISWNANGGDAFAFQPGAAPAPAAAAPAPAAAAPPPSSSSSSSDAGKPVVNLAAALAAGQDGTSAFGLKHVTADQKTKNRAAEDKKFTVPSELGPKSAPPKAFGGVPAKVVPPSFKKTANKLSVENYINDKTLKYEADEGGRDVIYLYNNKKTVLTLVKKVNSITIDKCTGTSLIVDDVISSIEIVNSKDITLQLLGVAASIVVDSTDEVKVYVTDKCAEKLEVFSSKSGNIVLYKPTKSVDPDSGEEYDGHLELAVPGTVRSVIVNNALDNSFVKHG